MWVVGAGSQRKVEYHRIRDGNTEGAVGGVYGDGQKQALIKADKTDTTDGAATEGSFIRQLRRSAQHVHAQLHVRA